MNGIELTTLETIETNTIRGLMRVPAHRYQDFATHRMMTDYPNLFRQYWTISHLPTGRACAGRFTSIELAADAMIEIARLRNDWAVMRDQDFTNDLRDKCDVIAKRYVGSVGSKPDNKGREPTFNGYSPEAT